MISPDDWAPSMLNREGAMVNKIAITYLNKKVLEGTQGQRLKYTDSHTYLVASACDDGKVRFRYLEVPQASEFDKVLTTSAAGAEAASTEGNASDDEFAGFGTAANEDTAAVALATPSARDADVEAPTVGVNTIGTTTEVAEWKYAVMESFQEPWERPAFDEHKAKVYTCAISNDSRFLLSCGADPSVVKYDVFTGEVIQRFQCEDVRPSFPPPCPHPIPSARVSLWCLASRRMIGAFERNPSQSCPRSMCACDVRTRS